MQLVDILRVYEGSKRLAQLGPPGEIAVNLFRAQKSSARAKVYRGGGYRGKAYDRKEWSIGNVTAILTEHATGAGITWGWGDDPAQPFHKDVLYVDLPTGQVSFHTAGRGEGPDYTGAWDRVRNASAQRICRWIAELLAQPRAEDSRQEWNAVLGDHNVTRAP